MKGPNESDLVELEFLASEKAIPYLIEMMRDLGDNLNTRDSLRIYDNEKVHTSKIRMFVVIFNISITHHTLVI